ncbi:AT hook motif DNA-binding family protein [Striga asiatica]|uniref:AT-hook motif nuclear-localized protein n=1 Tax=Striga asiatica TaxID=4170 RepID=A0A5A7PP53_STRAF|nr:AT hook motif DNA-binding family protein [Striga asiatica]
MEEQTAQPPESDLLQVPEAVAAEDSPENADGYGGGAVVVVSAGFGDDERLKRKRGRPRKVPPPEFVAAAELSAAAAPQKRGRGRPRGSGKWQTLAASLGGSVGDTAGTDFTPCIISIQAGENIVEKIWSFSQRIPDSLCILSAAGTGQFSIIYLNGSHTYDGKRGGKNCLLSVQLANPEGHFFGGAVAGSLIAAGPTQKLRHQVNVRPQHVESPKLSKSPVMVAVPVQAKPPEEAETKCEVGDLGSEQSFHEVGLKGPNNVSATPPVWRSVPMSGGSGSEFVGSSGFDSGVID